MAKTIINHPPNHHSYRCYKPFPHGLFIMFIIILPTLDPFPNDWWNFSPCFPQEPRRKPLGWLRSQARPWLCAIRPCPESHPPVPVQCATSNRYIKLAVPKKTMNGWMNYLKLCKLSELWNCNCFLSVCVCVFGGCAAVSPENYLCQLPPPKVSKGGCRDVGTRICLSKSNLRKTSFSFMISREEKPWLIWLMISLSKVGLTLPKTWWFGMSENESSWMFQFHSPSELLVSKHFLKKLEC